jgi:hypothetical protein
MPRPLKILRKRSNRRRATRRKAEFRPIKYKKAVEWNFVGKQEALPWVWFSSAGNRSCDTVIEADHRLQFSLRDFSTHCISLD